LREPDATRYSHPVRSDPYEVFSRVYDQDVHLEIPQAFYRTLRPLVRDARKGPPILDLGCGSGLVTERIAADGASVIGIDGSKPMLALARRRCRRWGDRVRLLHRRLDAMRLAPEAHLALACGDVINHLPRLPVVKRVLGSVRRALAPGGLLIVQGYTPKQLEYGTGGPKRAENMYTAKLLRESFGMLDILHLAEHEDVVDEGAGHRGLSALIDLVARRPAASS